MQSSLPLEPGHFYHVYDRGVNRTNIFIEDRNYAHFLELYARHVGPVAETFAYCLLGNHFHVLVRIRTDSRDRSGFRNRCGLETSGLGAGSGLGPPSHRAVSHAFNNWLNAYAKAVNKSYGRTGSLFQSRFGRLPITSERYLLAVVHYIHHNPQRHGLVKDFREWPYSSYHALLSDKPTRIERTAVLDWFGGPQAVRQIHATPVDESLVTAFVGNDEA